MTNPPKFKCAWIKKPELWKRVDDFRAQYWPEGTLPVDIEAIIELRLKLSIVPVRGIFFEWGIDAWLQHDLKGIVVDEQRYLNQKCTDRLRFYLAHEVGHFVLHANLYRSLQLNSIDEWKFIEMNLPPEEYGAFEWQANEFAGRLLVPRDVLEGEVQKARQLITHNSRLYDHLREDPDAVLPRISPPVARLFGVSEWVIETRIQRENLWRW